MSINRYFNLNRPNGTQQDSPKIVISNRDTDKYVTYDSKRTRLDRIANDVYNDSTYNWLILLGNPEYFLEFDIPTGTVIRVPFPLKDALQEYQQKIITFKDK
jgi:hypothetical protein